MLMVPVFGGRKQGSYFSKELSPNLFRLKLTQYQMTREEMGKIRGGNDKDIERIIDDFFGAMVGDVRRIFDLVEELPVRKRARLVTEIINRGGHWEGAIAKAMSVTRNIPAEHRTSELKLRLLECVDEDQRKEIWSWQNETNTKETFEMIRPIFEGKVPCFLLSSSIAKLADEALDILSKMSICQTKIDLMKKAAGALYEHDVEGNLDKILSDDIVKNATEKDLRDILVGVFEKKLPHNYLQQPWYWDKVVGYPLNMDEVVTTVPKLSLNRRIDFIIKYKMAVEKRKRDEWKAEIKKSTGTSSSPNWNQNMAMENNFSRVRTMHSGDGNPHQG